jgi:choline dehydrogenase-like flavoprotein
MKNDAEWDAVVVGAGAGGAAVAYGLCQRGMSVLLLDAGPRFNPILDYPLTESDWEARDFPEKPGSAASVTFAPGQKLTGAEPLLVSGSRGVGPLVTNGTRWMEKYYHVRGVGGTTLHFTGESHRMHPEAMKMQSRFGVAADWPIDLDPDQRDRFGIPLARISAWLEESDIRRLRFMAAKSRELLAASGAHDIFESYSSWDWFGASHVFGTCRMGADPGSSVVNANGGSHRWRNLWITDASVFPSSGGGEAPSLTIHALALRTAERIGKDD